MVNRTEIKTPLQVVVFPTFPYPMAMLVHRIEVVIYSNEKVKGGFWFIARWINSEGSLWRISGRDVTCLSFIWGGSLQVLIPSVRHHCDDEENVSSLRFQTVLSLELQKGFMSLSTYEAFFLAFFGLGSHHHNNFYSGLKAAYTSGKRQWILMFGSVRHCLLQCWICSNNHVTGAQ